MTPGFILYRRDIQFYPARDIPIRPLIDRLGFIADQKHWGDVFRFGHLEISQKDFRLMTRNMLLTTDQTDTVSSTLPISSHSMQNITPD